jgi:hypothetical protein
MPATAPKLPIDLVLDKAAKELDSDSTNAQIKKLYIDKGKIKCLVEFELDPKHFLNMRTTKSFMTKHIKGLQKIINKYTKAKMRPGIIEINDTVDRAVRRALERLGILT